MVANAPIASDRIALVSIHQCLLKRALDAGYSILSREIALAAV